MEQDLPPPLFRRLHCFLLCMRERLRWLADWFHHRHGIFHEHLRYRVDRHKGVHYQLSLLCVSRPCDHIVFSAHILSAVANVAHSGTILASPFAAIISDRFGRRWSMFIGACVIIVGSIIACSAGTVAQLTVARFILGAGIAVMTVSAPAVSEAVPCPCRDVTAPDVVLIQRRLLELATPRFGSMVLTYGSTLLKLLQPTGGADALVSYPFVAFKPSYSIKREFVTKSRILTPFRVLQLRLVRWVYPSSHHHFRLLLHQQRLGLEDPSSPPVLRLLHRSGLRLVSARVAPIPDCQRYGRGGCGLPRQVPRKRRSILSPCPA